MAFNPLNLKNSAAQLAAKTATQVSLNTNTKPKVFTASEATTAVLNYNSSVNTSSLDSIVANYQWVFDNISVAAVQGETSVDITTTNFDYTYIAPLLTRYGYTVSELPSSAVNPSDTSLKYNIVISWPSSTPTPIVGISPESFIAIQNSSYSVSFVPQGGQAPYTFSLAGQLPAGWTTSAVKNVSSLTISGTSSTLGGGSLILTVADSVGQTYTATINWTVTQPAQINADWTATTGLGQILNKPTSIYVGTSSLAFDRLSASQTLAGVSIDGNSATATLAANATLAAGLSASPKINSVTFNGSADITIPSLVNSSSTVSLGSDGILTFSSGSSIDTAYGTNDNGLMIMASTTSSQGPGDLKLVCDYNGQYSQVLVNRYGVGLTSGTSNNLGGFVNPSASISINNAGITVNGTILFNSTATFTGVTGITKAMIGLGNVTNESKTTMFTDSALTGTPTAPTATSGTNSTQIATTAFVSTAVSNLINGAGPALDTLNELATALGNDASFATTVTTSLSLKAPLASPAFTGTPTAPTPTTANQIAIKSYVDSRAFFALAVGIY